MIRPSTTEISLSYENSMKSYVVDRRDLFTLSAGNPSHVNRTKSLTKKLTKCFIASQDKFFSYEQALRLTFTQIIHK